jgi:hypothetical protein
MQLTPTTYADLESLEKAAREALSFLERKKLVSEMKHIMIIAGQRAARDWKKAVAEDYPSASARKKTRYYVTKEADGRDFVSALLTVRSPVRGISDANFTPEAPTFSRRGSFPAPQVLVKNENGWKSIHAPKAYAYRGKKVSNAFVTKFASGHSSIVVRMIGQKYKDSAKLAVRKEKGWDLTRIEEVYTISDAFAHGSEKAMKALQGSFPKLFADRFLGYMQHRAEKLRG